jgi:hypothetical protein
LGFWAALVVPSPKSQPQDVGVPVEVSVNWTAWLATGEAGLKVKEAVRVMAGATVTEWVTEFWPDAFMTVSVTLYVPAET